MHETKNENNDEDDEEEEEEDQGKIIFLQKNKDGPENIFCKSGRARIGRATLLW